MPETLELFLAPHPLLSLVALEAHWPVPLGEIASPPDLLALIDVKSVLSEDDLSLPQNPTREAVRDLLRHGGFSPSGRGKPCAEYIRAVTVQGRFPLINGAVDATNLAALHGGLPACALDADRLGPPLRVAIAGQGESYVFNASGQRIDLEGLLCLYDQGGPVANAVKDSERAKTTPATRRTLSLIWGTRALPGRTERVGAWLAARYRALGATVQAVPCVRASET